MLPVYSPAQTLEGDAALGVGGGMNQLSTAALHDQSRHQRASRYEQQWQGAYSRLQVRQPSTRISAGADAFAETVLLAQQAARQSKISDSDSGPTGHAATHRQLMGMKPGGGPRQWVAGVAPTTKGAPTRSLMMRLPTEGGAAELSVPARPAQHVENGVKPRGDAHVPPTPPPNWAYAAFQPRPKWHAYAENKAAGTPRMAGGVNGPPSPMLRGGGQRQLLASGASQQHMPQTQLSGGHPLGKQPPTPKQASRACVIS